VADQLPALVALGKFARVVGIGQAFNGAYGQALHVLMDCCQPSLYVVIMLPMTASTIPMLAHLPGPVR